jgi:hypothetical protein
MLFGNKEKLNGVSETYTIFIVYETNSNKNMP